MQLTAPRPRPSTHFETETATRTVANAGRSGILSVPASVSAIAAPRSQTNPSVSRPYLQRNYRNTNIFYTMLLFLTPMNRYGILMALAVLAVTITLFVGIGTLAQSSQESNTSLPTKEPPLPPPPSPPPIPSEDWEEFIVDSEGRVYFPEAVKLADWLFDNLGDLDNTTATQTLEWELRVLEYDIARLADNKIHVVLSTGDVRNVTTFEIEKIGDGVYREYTHDGGETVTYMDGPFP